MTSFQGGLHLSRQTPIWWGTKLVGLPLNKIVRGRMSGGHLEPSNLCLILSGTLIWHGWTNICGRSWMHVWSCTTWSTRVKVHIQSMILFRLIFRFPSRFWSPIAGRFCWFPRQAYKDQGWSHSLWVLKWSSWAFVGMPGNGSCSAWQQIWIIWNNLLLFLIVMKLYFMCWNLCTILIIYLYVVTYLNLEKEKKKSIRRAYWRPEWGAVPPIACGAFGQRQ